MRPNIEHVVTLEELSALLAEAAPLVGRTGSMVLQAAFTVLVRVTEEELASRREWERDMLLESQRHEPEEWR